MDAPRTADGLPSAPARHRGLAAVGILEIVSLLVLLGNLATVHDPALARVVGPIHGTLYLIGIAAAFGATKTMRSRLLGVIPFVGALIAWRAVRAGGDRRERTTP